MAFVLDEEQETVKQPQQRFVIEEEEQLQPVTPTQFAPGAQIDEATARQVIRGGARALETALGLPGDIAGLGGAITDFLGSKVGLPTRQELAQRAEEKAGRKTALGIEIPGSQEFNSLTSEITDGYLDPRTGGEEFADEVVRDFTALALGKVGSAEGIKAIAKPLLASLGANSAKEIAGSFGAGDKTQAALKIGTMLAIDLIGKKSPTDLKNELYKDAAENLPKDASISAKKITKQLNTLEKELAKGGSSASVDTILKKIKETKKAVKGGKITVDELQAFKRKVNEAAEPLYRDLSKNSQKKLRGNVNKYRSIVKDGIADYGKTNKPFMNSWTKAEEVNGAIEQSRRVRTNLTNAIKKNPKVSAIAGAGLLNPFGIGLAKTGAIAALPTAAGVASLEFGSRVLNSPTLRTHYKNIISSSIRDDIAGITNNINKYNRDIKKELDEDEEFNALFQSMLDEQK